MPPTQQVCFEQDDKTALHLAATSGKTTVVELLLQHGADLNATSKVQI